MSTQAEEPILATLDTVHLSEHVLPEDVELPDGPIVTTPASRRSPRRSDRDNQATALARRHRVILRAADVCAAAVAATLGAIFLQAVEPLRAGDIVVLDLVVASIAIVMSLHVHGLYRRPASRLRPSGWWRPTVVVRCMPTATLLALGSSALLASGDRMTLTAAVAMTLPATWLIPVGRRVMVKVFGPPTTTRILVVGNGQVAKRVLARLARCPDTVVVGLVDSQVEGSPPENHTGPPVLGGIHDLIDVCADHHVDRIVVSFSRTNDREVLEVVRKLDGRVPVSVVPRMFELLSWRSEIEELHGLPLVHVPPAKLYASSRVAKRTLDLAVAVSVLLLILPLWLVVAAAIKLDSAGPVFFRQERAGRGGRPFRIFKFRTMTTDAWEQRSTIRSSNEVDGPLFKMQCDPRVTRVGRFLRRTSIDELPQLLNVVAGHMSLVGPRPLPVEESDRLDGAALTRFDVAPGITGLWQVSGRSDLSYADLQHLDSVYVRSWSLMWDLRIIGATPRSVLGGRGAY